MHHLLLKEITKTLGLGWFGVVYSWSLCILDKMYQRGNFNKKKRRSFSPFPPNFVWSDDFGRVFP
jgi:hypothetical protein